MVKHPKRKFCLLTLITIFLLTGCMGPAEEFIQGGWRYDDKHLANIVAEQHLTILWYFDNGTFLTTACCFNVDEEIRGRYRVLEQTEDEILIELFNAEGVNRKIGGQYFIKIDRQAETLSIMGTDPFYRISP